MIPYMLSAVGFGFGVGLVYGFVLRDICILSDVGGGSYRGKTVKVRPPPPPKPPRAPR